MKIRVKILLALVVLGIVSCEQDHYDDSLNSKHARPKKYKRGKADFSNFVAIGNSLTAGYADSALYIDGQINSYPNILAGQFAYAKGGSFTQPLMADNSGGALLFGNQILANKFVLNGGSAPSRYVGAPTTEISNVLTGPFNNMGVAGAKSFHLVTNGYGNIANLATGTANPYFVRMASSPNASMLEDAVAQNPTFFSLWIGNNDILSYALGGGTGVDHNTTGNEDPTTYGDQDITNVKVFRRSYNKLLRKLTGKSRHNSKKGTEGIVINLPNVNSLAYFTTVPHNPLSPLNPVFAAQIPTLNATFAGLNQAFHALGVSERAIVFSENEASAVVVKDESLADISTNLTAVLTPAFGADLASILGAQYGQARQATASDLLVLTSGGVIAQLDTNRVTELMQLGLTQEQAASFSVSGVSLPLGDEYVLTPDEQNTITAAVSRFNSIIYRLSQKYDIAHLDAASDLDQIANGGIPYDGGVLTSDFITGGAFSLDGVHPSARGYAFVANRIIDEIEKKYKSRLPRVSLADYPTVN